VIDNTRKTYFSPQDDTVAAFIAFIQTAQKKIRIADYSFNLEPLVEVLIAKHGQNVDVQLVLDKSESVMKSEAAVIKQLADASVMFVVGTSSKDHQIMHNKFTIIDDAWVQSGSWNYTTAAADEDNFFDIEHSTDRAQAFTADWQKMYDWITTYEGRATTSS
jgi:phosphatidylserine/phosphatidylglycerophosphate/cardiolipin synthase-like enzyme